MIPLLIQWYNRNRRLLPWRAEQAPYHVWISEIMLQQTRIEAGIPYYIRFIAELPDVPALSRVEDDRLMKLWEGLGYYSRARNLKKAALVLTAQYGGALPADAAALRTLPGIGEYTAGAIASIAFGLPEPAVDGNVMRVLARLLCDPSDVLKPATKAAMTELLRRSYPVGDDAALLTEGIMELGETICLPNGAPRCADCPIRELCLARVQEKTAEIPFRAPKPARRIIPKTVFLIRCQNRYALRRRCENGLLAGTYEFPNIDGHLTEHEAADFLHSLQITPLQIETAPQSKHIFTHLEWHMHGYFAETDCPPDTFFWASANEICEHLPVATAFRAYTAYLSGRSQESKNTSQKG